MEYSDSIKKLISELPEKEAVDLKRKLKKNEERTEFAMLILNSVFLIIFLIVMCK